MTDEPPVEEGDTATHSRTFTKEDVETFVDLSEDEGYHHVVSQGRGEVMVHGLLTATIPTKVGGDLDFIAQKMEFGFLKPVYTGEEITCELVIDEVEEEDTKYRMSSSFVCKNEEGEVVMEGSSDGVIFK